MQDKNGRNYITVSDFVFTGFPLGILTVCLMLSFGYGMMVMYGL